MQSPIRVNVPTWNKVRIHLTNTPGLEKPRFFGKKVFRVLSFEVLAYNEERTQNCNPGRTSYTSFALSHRFLYITTKITHKSQLKYEIPKNLKFGLMRFLGLKNPQNLGFLKQFSSPETYTYKAVIEVIMQRKRTSHNSMRSSTESSGKSPTVTA